MPSYHLQPLDLLFFRDARPMESQSTSGGHGARWPHPAVFFDALHAALWRAFPSEVERSANGFLAHSFYRKRNGERTIVRPGGTFFQSLTTAGPFPVLNGSWLFPAPADLQPGDGRVLPIPDQIGQTDISTAFSLWPLGSTVRTCKERMIVPWWSKAAIERYLAGSNTAGQGDAAEDDALFGSEWITGIGMDAATQAQDGERIYSAQYLRLRDEARLGVWASLPTGSDEGMDKLFQKNDVAPALVVGGQQRICQVERLEIVDLAQLLPVSRPLPNGCTRIKWVLLSPAVFGGSNSHPGGWLPTWIHPSDGGVLLNKVATDPAAPRTRRVERRRMTSDPLLQKCKLVAACIPKPIPLTGWTESLHVPDGDPRKSPGPRATQLAVPAGAVYYFDCPDPETARTLWELLSWHGKETAKVGRIMHRRSSLLGEKGFGLGICTEWNPFPAKCG